MLRLKYYLSLLLLFMVTTVYYVSKNGSNKIFEQLSSSLNREDSCSASLASQVELLKTEYRRLLPGVTHVAVIGFPGYS